MEVPGTGDAVTQDLFAGFCGEPGSAEFGYPEAEATGGEQLYGEEGRDDVEGDEIGERSGKDEAGGPTPEQLLEWQSKLARRAHPRSSRDHSGVRFQGRCFAVEWRSSAVLDGDVFVQELFRLIGGEVSFVLGMEARKMRADYRVVVRSRELIRWRDWKKKLMFGHGGEVEGEPLYMRVEVPSRGSEECTRAFVNEMVSKCELYEQVWRYNEQAMRREHDKGYPRPGRRRSPVEK